MTQSFKRTSPLAVAVLVIVTVIMMLCSCRGIQAPPGYIASGTGAAGRIEFPSGQSTEAGYSLLRWYVEQQEEVTDSLASAALAVAGNAATERANELRLSLFVRLQKAYPEVVSLRREEGSIAIDGMALAQRNDWAAMETMLNAIEAQVGAVHWVTVPVDEAVRFLENDQRREMVTAFQLWCVGHPRLKLPPVPDAEELLLQLKDIREALRQKQALLSVMASAEAKLDHPATAAEAQRVLEAAEEDFPTMDAVLAAIGDSETCDAFRKALAEAPERWVQVTLQELETKLSAGEALDAQEAVLSAALPQWGSAGAFAAGSETEARCRDVVRRMLERREKELLGRLELLCARSDYWGAAVLLEEARKRYVSPGVPETACYSFFNGGEFAAQLGERLNASFVRHLPDAYHLYQVAQDAALNVDNRFALVLSYDECFRRVAAAMDSTGGRSLLPEAARQALGRSHANAARARQMLGRLPRMRPIVVDVESAELAEQVRTALAESLESVGLSGFFQAATAVPSRVSAAGVLRLKVTGLRERCEAPSGMPQESRDTRQVGDSEVMVTSVRNILEADVIVTAHLEQGETAVRTLDAEKKCLQEFIRESAEPQSQPLPEKFLRNDRVWTEKELLESTRIQAIQAVCGKLLEYLRKTGPEALAAQAEELASGGRLLDAADRLSEARLLAGTFPQPRNEFREEAMKRIAALMAEVFVKEKVK